MSNDEILIKYDQNRGYIAQINNVYMWAAYNGYMVADLIDGKYQNQCKYPTMPEALDDMRLRGC